MEKAESSVNGNPNNERPKATLADFVKDNSTLITGVAAFAALTAFFSTQLKDAAIQAILPGVTLLGAFLLAYELWMRAPAPPRHWRLAVFELVIMAILANVGWYWVKMFPSLWGVPLIAAIYAVLLLGPAILLTLLISKIAKLVSARVFHKQIAAITMLRLQRSVFLFFLVADTVGYFWVGHKLIPNPITIHTP
jgi:hypothetical protein